MEPEPAKDRCAFCGNEAREVLELHHIVPRSAGGTDSPGNLIPLCANCHRKVHAHGLVPGQLPPRSEWVRLQQLPLWPAGPAPPRRQCWAIYAWDGVGDPQLVRLYCDAGGCGAETRLVFMERHAHRRLVDRRLAGREERADQLRLLDEEGFELVPELGQDDEPLPIEMLCRQVAEMLDRLEEHPDEPPSDVSVMLGYVDEARGQTFVKRLSRAPAETGEGAH